MNNFLVSLIKTFEGLARRLPNGLVGPYICPAGYPTQGYGLLVKDMKVPPITVEECEHRLNDAIPHYVLEALKACPNLARQPPERIAAIADFTFNLGASRLRSSTLRRKILAEDWEGACQELAKWVNGGGRRLPGLVLRRAAEAALIRRTM